MIYILSCDTTSNGGGIYAYNLTQNGKFKKQGYFPCEKPMYAVKTGNELCVLLREPFEHSKNSGYFFVDKKLTTKTEVVDTKGVIACHLCVDCDNVYVTNYVSGNVSKNGELVEQRVGSSVHPTRQDKPHTHFITKTPDGYFAVCDLGTDTLAIYNKDLTLISEEKVPLGYGIRHLVYSNNGKHIYAINELVPSVSVFSYENGKAKHIKTINIACKNEKANGAAIRLSSDGKFLYVSLRVENVICVFSVDNENLTLVQKIDAGVDSPRDFNLFSNYLISLGEKSNNAVVFLLKDGLIESKLDEITINCALCCL